MGAEILGLTREDRDEVDLKVALTLALRRRLARKPLTQAQLAKLVGSSEARVVFMAPRDASVSIDLLVTTLLALGASLKDVADAIRSAERRRGA
jgi:hypothetical protein